VGREVRRMCRDSGNVTPLRLLHQPTSAHRHVRNSPPLPAQLRRRGVSRSPQRLTLLKSAASNTDALCALNQAQEKQLANSLQCGLPGFQSVPLPPRSQLRHGKADHGHRHGDSQYCVKRRICDTGTSHVYPRGAWHKYSNCDIIARV